MTLAKFAQEIKTNYPNLTHCYIAVMPNGNGVDQWYDLEVETSLDSVGGTYEVDTWEVDEARDEADKLEIALNKLGIQVFDTRRAWQAYCEIIL